MKGENREPWFLKLNPRGQVPTLDDGGTVVWDSMAAVAIGRFFPEHDLTFLQMLVAVGGFLAGVVLDLSFKSRAGK